MLFDTESFQSTVGQRLRTVLGMFHGEDFRGLRRSRQRVGLEEFIIPFFCPEFVRLGSPVHYVLQRPHPGFLGIHEAPPLRKVCCDFMTREAFGMLYACFQMYSEAERSKYQERPVDFFADEEERERDRLLRTDVCTRGVVGAASNSALTNRSGWPVSS